MAAPCCSTLEALACPQASWDAELTPLLGAVCGASTVLSGIQLSCKCCLVGGDACWRGCCTCCSACGACRMQHKLPLLNLHSAGLQLEVSWLACCAGGPGARAAEASHQPPLLSWCSAGWDAVQVRLEHMLQRLRCLQDAAATAVPSQLLPHLFISGAVPASSFHVLKHLGITHILNATQDLPEPPPSAGFTCAGVHP